MTHSSLPADPPSPAVTPPAGDVVRANSSAAQMLPAILLHDMMFRQRNTWDGVRWLPRPPEEFDGLRWLPHQPEN